MTFKIVIILIAMILSYGIVKWKGFSVELSILITAIAGGIVGAFFYAPPWGELFRHLIEGTFTYLDIVLVFSTATIFMSILSESGVVNFVVKKTIKTFFHNRVFSLILLMFIILIPGALTGAGSVSVLVVGTPVVLALRYLGITEKKVAAILFIVAGLSAAAPPVNIWAMILSAGTAIPYVGFELTLGIPILILGIFTVLFLGLKKEKEVNLEKALQEIPEAPKGMNWWRVILPFVVFFGLIIISRIWPFDLPFLGLPLQFVLAAVTALLLSPKKINILVLSRETVKRLLPLLATVTVVGVLQQIMTVTGVRGLLSYLVISAPLVWILIVLPVIIPLSEGLLAYGGAAIVGIPLVWFFDSIGLHATVAIAALSLMWPLGDGVPPTALIGRLTIMVADYKGSYWSFIKTTWVPWIVITAVAMLMIIYSTELSFLVRWSM